MKKAIILFSGGLDSRLVTKIIEKQNFEIHLLYVHLPFESNSKKKLKEIKIFSKNNNYFLHTIDVTKGKKYIDYINLIKNPKYDRGTGLNPCKDCKIFIYKEGAKLMEKLKADILVSGEVMNQRPMSQKKKTLEEGDIIAGLNQKILRPLSAKKFSETIYEKNNLIERKNLYEIDGRRRNIQIELAKKFKIDYPEPSGGCLLCEKIYSKRLKFIYQYFKERLPKYEEILLLKNARMFKIRGLIFIGRNKKENDLITKINKKLKWQIYMNINSPGPTIIYEEKKDQKNVKNLWEAYSNKDLEKRKNFKKYEII